MISSARDPHADMQDEIANLAQLEDRDLALLRTGIFVISTLEFWDRSLQTAFTNLI